MRGNGFLLSHSWVLLPISPPDRIMKLNLNPISAIADSADKILGRFKQSPEEKNRAALAKYQAETDRLGVTKDERMADHAERMERLKIEQAVAQSREAAKIRPRIGNVTVFGFITMISPIASIVGITILHVFANFIASMFGHSIPEPELKPLYDLIDLQKEYSEMLYVLLATALGEGYLRTREKEKNVEGNRS